MRDPDCTHLDRVQISKGWLDEDDKTHERIYDVAFFDIPLPERVPATVQDRAYTSPISNTPD